MVLLAAKQALGYLLSIREELPQISIAPWQRRTGLEPEACRPV